MEVYFVEKPEVAKHLSSVLSKSPSKKQGYYDCGGGVYVTWAVGHLLALKDPHDFDSSYKKWSLEQLPMKYGIGYKPNPKTKAQLSVVSKLLKEADIIYAACDIDAAGQSISDEVMSYLNINPASAKRVLINDNNPSKIAKAIHPSAVKSNADYQTLYKQELCRSILDQRVGYNLTRLLSCKASEMGWRTTLNVGRVQSSILGLVCRREIHRKGFQKTHYYNVTAEFVTSVGALPGRLKLDDSCVLDVDEKGNLNNREQVQLLTESLHGQNAVITKLESKRTEDSSPMPWDLLSLQVECSRLFSMDAEDVLKYTQELRESPYYAITYNRSDCRYLPDEAFDEAPQVIENLATTGLLTPLTNQCDSSIKSRAFNSKKTGAHGGIAPTGSVEGFDEMPDHLKAVFLLICRNYLIQFMPKRERHIVDYEMLMESTSGLEYSFVGRKQKVTELGWSIVFQNDAENEDAALEDVDDFEVGNLTQGEVISGSTVRNKQLESKALPSYTKTTLLKDLKSTAKYITDPKIKAWMLEKDKDNAGEHGGIGTAATRSAIVKALFDNGFLEVDSKGKVIPTEKGMLLFKLLPSRITSPETTAIWSHFFKCIEDGTMEMGEVLAEVDAMIAAEVKNVKRYGLDIPQELIPNQKSAKCPHCKQMTAQQKNGKYRKFWACSNCNKFSQDLDGAPFKKMCPQCRKPLKIVLPKKKSVKPFIACTGFPNCDHKEWIN